METKALIQVEQLALKKLHIYEQSILRYWIRSMIASMFIGFGVIVAFKTGGFFYIVDSPMAYPMAAVTFGAAIILISYGGGDLFTGNTFYFTYATLRKKMTWKQTIKLWITSYFGNFAGAALFAFIIWITALFADPEVNSFLVHVADKKLHYDTWELFFRGILCNWLVCLAFFIPMSMKNDGAKMFAMILFVFCFFISGYEHSIANMSTFAVAAVVQEWGTITLTDVLHNLIPVTLGNMIGGGVFMGCLYYYLNKPYQESEELQ